MLESFGARLRARREEQGIALTTIAEQTKIKLSLLEALERDDVSHWPSGIFGRAFIRAYAQAIDLPPDLVVREFLEVHPEPTEVVAMPPKADDARTAAGPPTRLRYIVGSAIGSLARLRRPIAEALTVSVPAPAESELEAVAHTPPEAAELHPNDAPEAPELHPNDAVVAEPPPVTAAASGDPDMLAVASLCTEFGRVENVDDLRALLPQVATILDATGLIVWVWDGLHAELRPALAHGYSDKILAQLPAVSRDADNATAAAFRSSQVCAIDGSDRGNGALAVPLVTPAGCAGVLAIELRHGREQAASVRAVATIFAAMLAQLIGTPPAADATPAADAAPAPDSTPSPIESDLPMLRATAR